jgi:O-acetylserine/cysteine efflux transporter
MSLKDTFIAIFVIFLWATSLIVQKIALGHISIYILSFLRLLSVVPLLLLYTKPTHPISRYFLAGLFWNALNWLFLGFGLKSGVGAGLSSFLMQTNVLFGVLFCFLFLREKVTLIEVVGMAVAFFGTYLLTQARYGDTSDISFLGIISILISAICWGIGFTLLKKFKIGAGMADNVWLSVISIPSLMAIPFIIEGPQEAIYNFTHLSSIGILCSVYVGLVSTVWAGYLWLSLAQRVSSLKQTPFMLLLPVFTCLLSALLLNETLTLSQITAGAVILLGVFIARFQFLIKKFHLAKFFKKSPSQEPSPREDLKRNKNTNDYKNSISKIDGSLMVKKAYKKI